MGTLICQPPKSPGPDAAKSTVGARVGTINAYAPVRASDVVRAISTPFVWAIIVALRTGAPAESMTFPTSDDQGTNSSGDGRTASETAACPINLPWKPFGPESLTTSFSTFSKF